MATAMAKRSQLVFKCEDDAGWEKNFNPEKKSQKLVVVYFSAAWCGPCRIINPTLDKLADTMTHVLFLEVDVDKFRVADEYKVEAMPTFVFIKNGEELANSRVVGAKQRELRDALKKYI